MKHLYKLYLLLPFIIGIFIQQSCNSGRKVPASEEVFADSIRKKVHLNLEEIDENGLYGPPDGRRSISYEFCIPIDASKRREVHRIDPRVRFFDGPSGRVGCSDGQYLCIGSGGSPKVILKLASLPYIKRIKPCYWE